ncbi:MAG: glycosyltransferase [Planctomycetes bacterium]|nr:glycosyltransferase [Planctomycetota bacterium]
MRLSIVIPVYNEEGVIGAALAATTAFASARGIDCEVICVDDGSRDGSASEIAAFAARDPRVVLHRLPRNRGKGAAVREGVLRARGENVFFLDADLSTPLEELDRFLPRLDAGVDLVLGNRKARESQILVRQPWLRERLGKVFTALCRALLAPGIDDFTCGFKGFRAAAARAVFQRSSLDGWAFDAELVVIARALELRIEQLPVRWKNDPGSKVRIFSAITGALRDLLVLCSRRWRGSYRRER